MFQKDDPTFVHYQQLQQSFGGNSVVILVYQDQDLRSNDGMARNRQIADLVKEIGGVKGVLSPAKLNSAVTKLQPLSLFSSEPALFQEGNEIAEGFDSLFAGYTHSRDYQRAAIVAILHRDRPPETLEKLKAFANQLSERFASAGHPVGSAVLVGEPVLVNDGFELIERDGNRLAAMTVLLLSLVVLVSLADLRFVLLLATSIVWSVLVTKASMVWLSINLSIVSSILTAIVTVIAVAATLHLGVRFRVSRARGLSQRDAAVRAFAMLTLPILWTCATDAAGFVALYASGILPVRQFGIMVAVSAIAVLVSVLLIAPAVMMLPASRLQFGLGKLVAIQEAISRRLRRSCQQITTVSIMNRGWCLGFVIVALLLALPVVGRVQTETSFLNNFREGSHVVRAYDEVETHFGGAGVWDVVVESPQEITAEYLNEVRDLERKLRRISVGGNRLTKVLSIADAEWITSKAPLTSVATPASRLSFMSLAMPSFYKALLTSPKDGKRQLRIMLRSREHVDAYNKAILIEAVESTIADHVQSDSWQAAGASKGKGHATGYYVLMARLVDQLVNDQWRCFAASGILVWVLLVFATRSLRLATMALLPNLLPVLLVLAAVGLLGFKINMGAAMIAAVSIGLSIDGSVHFLSGYQRSRRRGNRPHDSAVHAAGNVGVPVFLATVALAFGFAVLGTSEFVPTATFGLLVAATLILGTIVNLTLLPALVTWSD